VAVVIGRVVDEDIGTTAGVFDLGEGGGQGGQVRQVAIAENGRLRQVRQLLLQRQRRLAGDIEKGDVGALARERLDDGYADAGAPPVMTTR